MIRTDELADRETLRRNAVARQRRNRRRLLIALAVLVPATSLFPVLFLDQDRSIGRAAIVVATPALLVLLIVAVVVPVWRRQDRALPLSLGADRETRSAVARALREGGTTDPRIDALARDAAEHGRRRPWLVWLLAVGAALQAAGFVLRFAGGDRDWFGAAATGVLMVLFALQGFTMLRTRRRSIRYPAGVRRPVPR